MWAGRGECETERHWGCGGQNLRPQLCWEVLGSEWIHGPQFLHLQHGLGVWRRLTSRGLPVFNILHQRCPAEMLCVATE